MITRHSMLVLWSQFGGYSNRCGIKVWFTEEAKLCPTRMDVPQS